MFTKTILSGNLILIYVIVIVAAREIVNNKPQLKEKPEWLKTCKRSDPNENQCFKHLFEGMFPSLAKGIPEIGVKKFEPLYIDSVSISKGSGNLVLSGGFKHLIVKGPSNATVENAVLDFDKNILNFDLKIPLLRINAKYNLNGNILLLPLLGNGDVTMLLSDVKTSVYTDISIKGIPEDAIRMETMKVTFIVGGMRIHLTNLFNGNEILAASLNAFLNQHSHEIISELRPDLEAGLSDIFKGLWNNVFSKIPLKFWLV